MNNETLAKLFSSGTLVKVMRLFLFNPYDTLDKETIAQKTKSPAKSVTYETKLLADIGFLKERSVTKIKTTGTGKKARKTKKRIKGFVLDESFPFLGPLKALLVNTELMDRGELEKRLSGIGRMRLIALAGIFMQEEDRQVDLLLVGDRIHQAKLMSAIKAIESAMGAELRYSVLSPNDFEYRLGVGDRLVRDVFDFPHLIVRNNFGSLVRSFVAENSADTDL